MEEKVVLKYFTIKIPGSFPKSDLGGYKFFHVYHKLPQLSKSNEIIHTNFFNSKFVLEK